MYLGLPEAGRRKVRLAFRLGTSSDACIAMDEEYGPDFDSNPETNCLSLEYASSLGELTTADIKAICRELLEERETVSDPKWDRERLMNLRLRGFPLINIKQEGAGFARLEMWARTLPGIVTRNEAIVDAPSEYRPYLEMLVTTFNKMVEEFYLEVDRQRLRIEGWAISNVHPTRYYDKERDHE